MKIDDRLSQVFDIEPVKEGEVIMSSGEVVTKETSDQSEKIENDYDRTRSNLHSLFVPCFRSRKIIRAS
jgi:hypothetical protein